MTREGGTTLEIPSARACSLGHIPAATSLSPSVSPPPTSFPTSTLPTVQPPPEEERAPLGSTDASLHTAPVSSQSSQAWSSEAHKGGKQEKFCTELPKL